MAAGFILFCALLRWQLWHCRIHLAWFVLLAPWTSTLLTVRAPRWLFQVAAAVVGTFAVYCAFNNISRPVFDRSWLALPREALYLKVSGPELYSPLATAVDDLLFSKCAHVGLELEFNDPEYPIWIILQNRGFTGRLSHFLVDNESARIPAAGPAPCAVLVSITNVTSALTNRFPCEFDYGPVRTFWSEPASHWARLAEFDSDKEHLHPLPASPGPLFFDHGRIDLHLRSPRAGIVHLEGLVTDATGKPINDNPLRVTTDSGFEQTPAVQGQTFSVLIPSTGGDCKITLALVDATPGNAPPRLEKLRWSWENGE